MTPRVTNAEQIAKAVAGMPAPQALRYLADLIRPGVSLSRGLAVAQVLDTIAETMTAGQQVVRSGLPIDSLPVRPLTLREYGVRATRPDGTVFFVTYGDRLFSAARDAARVPDAEIMRRNVTVGAWVVDTSLTDGGVVRVLGGDDA
jgi:hypothetical protein